MVLGLVQGVPLAAGLGAAAAATSSADGPAVTVEEALARAKASGEPVELATMLGESSELLVNPDGTHTSVQHLRPVRTRKNGRWVKIDTALKKRADGSIGPVATTVGLTLSGGGDGPLATVDEAGRQLVLGWKGTLPEPALDGDTALYAEVLPGVDLQVRAEPTGFSHVLVVKTREAAANPALVQVRYPLTGKGVQIKADAAGKIIAVDEATGGTVFETPVPLMWDSTGSEVQQVAAPEASPTATPSSTQSGEPSSAESLPDEQAPETDTAQPQSRLAVTQESEPAPSPQEASTADLPAPDDFKAPIQASTADGPGDGAQVVEMATAVSGQEMVLTPDARLLASPDTQFPVFIDPQTTTVHAAEWAMTTSAYPSTTYYKFKGKDNEGMGYCHSSFVGCGSSHIKRLHYEFPISAYAGKSIIDAEFQVKETHSSSCTKTPVELWWTDNFADQIDWDKQKESGWWRRQLATKNEANGWSADCPASDVIFDQTAVKDALVDALAAGQSRFAFGLRAGDEADRLGWKRFHYDAAFRISYNTLPSVPKTTEMQTSPGGACVTGTPTPVNQLPQLQAYLQDADAQDSAKVQGQFRLRWDGVDKWTSALTNAQTTKTWFKQTLPSTVGGAAIPQSKIIEWDVRAYDGTAYSAWSPRCRFMYDTTAPAAPTVTSSTCPTDGAAGCAVGQAVSFTVDSTSTDVTGYRVWFDDGAYTDYAVTSGAAKTVSYTPTRTGASVLHVQAYDAAKKFSADNPYTFVVAAGRKAVAQWKLDDQPGANPLADVNPDGDAKTFPLTHDGGVVAGANGIVNEETDADGNVNIRNTAIRLPGTDSWPTASGPVITTTANFTVSAWAYLENGAAHAAIISQDGNRMSGFSLSYRTDQKKWGLLRMGQDSDTYTNSYWLYSTETAQVGRWTHLVGVFNSAAGKIQLYVNGKLSGELAAPNGFDATGSFVLGRSKWKGALVDRWTGKIDEVQVYDRLLPAEEIADLYAASGTVVAGRWKLNKGTSGTDDSVFSRHLTFGGGAVIGTDNGYTNDQGLALDGIDDYAATSVAPVRASESFTVAGWVRATSATPARNGTAFSQAGAATSAFSVRYNATSKRWRVEVPSADSATATLQSVEHPNFLTASTDLWDHLAVVYEAPKKELRLYVRGQLAESVSVRGNTVAFDGANLQVGRRMKPGGGFDEYWAGTVDDVWAFQGVASEDVIAQRAAGAELDTYRDLTERLWLGFNDGDGADLSPAGNDATLGSGANFATEELWDGGGASLLLNGQSDSTGTTSGPVVDTSQSFSVAAWVKLTSTGAVYTVAGQDGTNVSGFFLQYHKTLNRWVFNRYATDGVGTGGALAQSTATPQLNTWTHLTGVYDRATQSLRLYVNGVLQQETVWTYTPWNATGPTSIGRGRYAGADADAWVGELDDVRLYQGVLSSAQIARLSLTDR
ncbi:LamG-like jellyroll fold domain-containing protein [Nonomuraea angiospora]|uniref:LamG-like jellyroll fold domain-containing protein n=1 Tax=Nonomuraea angiospora TaxID=46172 RepID=UPI00344F45B6